MVYMLVLLLPRRRLRLLLLLQHRVRSMYLDALGAAGVLEGAEGLLEVASGRRERGDHGLKKRKRRERRRQGRTHITFVRALGVFGSG